MYPGRFECLFCHNAAAGRILGFTLRQLDRSVVCPGAGPQHQFDVLARRGVISAADAGLARSAPRQPLVPLHDSAAPLEVRVRSYLDVNCSACHNPQRHFAAFDARFRRPLGETGVIDGASHHHGILGPDVRIVRPGDLEHSMLHLRLSAAEPVLRMPPLGSTVVDRHAAATIAEWIRSLPPSPATSAAAVIEPDVRDNLRR